MAKTIITADMVGDPNSPLIGRVILDGDDRPNVGTVYMSVDDCILARTLHLAKGVYQAAIAEQHPEGFPGILRAALTAYLKQCQDERWAEGEREVDADIAAGRVTTFDNVEDFMASLGVDAPDEEILRSHPELERSVEEALRDPTSRVRRPLPPQ